MNQMVVSCEEQAERFPGAASVFEGCCVIGPGDVLFYLNIESQRFMMPQCQESLG
jgi:hypothetical protein